jgi:hypothetical protein
MIARFVRLFLLGTFLSLYFAFLIYRCEWALTHLLLAKGFAFSNAIALAGLYVQRKGYSKVLSVDDSKQEQLEQLFLYSFLACFCLFFGITESLSAAYLSWSFRKIAKQFRPFTGLQMFSQLPEATAVFALGSVVSPFSHLPLIVLQQAFVLRLMFGGGLGTRRVLDVASSFMIIFFVVVADVRFRIFCGLLLSLIDLHRKIERKLVEWRSDAVSLLDNAAAKHSLAVVAQVAALVSRVRMQDDIVDRRSLSFVCVFAW